MSTVRPVPAGAVVATAVDVVYPRPPTSVVSSKLATVFFALAAMTVIVAVFVGAVPPRFVPAITMVLVAVYPVPGEVTVVR